jgi:cation diffusion facilitator family transporter
MAVHARIDAHDAIYKMIPAQFPAAIELPGEVESARGKRTTAMVRVASVGIGVRMVVIALELIGFWWFSYSVLLVDALASVADVAASLLIIFAIKLAERPPDENHPFGHGRYEPLAGLQLGLLIILLGGYLFFQQLVYAAHHPAAGSVHVWAWLVPAFATVLLELAGRMVHRAARRENSSALVAEALHYRIDAVTSLLAAAGLAIAYWLVDWSHLLDHLFAMILAGIVVVLGVQAALENLHQILDRAPNDEFIDLVRSAAQKVDGVLDVEKVRIQTAGPDAHVDTDVEVEPSCTVSQAHVVAQRVRAQVQTEWPAVRDVVVHVEPYYDGDH